LLHQEEDQRFCTVCYLRIRAKPGEGLALTTSCGGHPLPLVLRGDGTVSSVGEPGTLLGVFPDPVLRDQDYGLAPGDSLLMYTDGITDERGADGTEFGEDRVRQALTSCSGLDADAIADRIVASVQGYHSGPPRDDIAVLVIRAKP
jgi:serine phosphatase RsbU (regulator of sigma subunit)